MFMHPDELHASIKPGDFESTGEKYDAGWSRKLNESKAPAGSTYKEAGLAPADASGWSTSGYKDDTVHGSGLHEAISKSGIESPVNVWHSKWTGPSLVEGHHRVAVATDLTRQGRHTYIPVEHDGAERLNSPENFR